MKKTVRISSMLVAIFATVLAIAPMHGQAAAPAQMGTSAPTSTYNVYVDNLANNWQDWSWGASVTVQDGSYHHAGSYSISAAYTAAWGGLQLGNSTGLNTSGYDTFTFYVNGGSSSGQQVLINFMDLNGNDLPFVNLNSYVQGGSIGANTWRQVSVPLSALGATNVSIGNIILQDNLGGAQPRFYVDDMQFTSSGTATATPTAARTATSTPPGGTPQPTATPASGLPPIPSGLPNYFSYGLFNADTSTLPGGVPLNLRYQYLAGGANTGDGWATWGSNGSYATNYINDAHAVGAIPSFIYYQILQSAPNYDEWSNFQDNSTMRAYYDDFKLLMQKCGQAGGTVFVDLEPDLNGVMQQHPSNTNDDANLQHVDVASSGQSDVQAYPNTFRGFYQALAHIRDTYAPNVLLGLDVSPWGASEDITLALRDDPSYDWRHHATRTATYMNSFGPGYQLLGFNPLDRDAGYYESQQGSNRWWDDTNTHEPKFDTMASWLGMIISQTQKRAILWQVPNGNRVYRTENNTDGHYQDNRAEYFLNPTSGRAHMSGWANQGVVGIMFGAGAGSQSHYFDYKSDGITNPPPINGNTTVSSYPDDDGGYLRLQLGAYYSGGTVPLPGGGSQNTPTPVRTNTPTRVPPTATRTNTPSASTPTRTSTRTPTRTNTPALPSATRTNTPRPTNTRVVTSTRTQVPPTRTNTPVQPTATRTPTGPQAVRWTGKVNVATWSNNVTKLGGAANTWDAGAASNLALQSGDGYVQATVDDTSSNRMFGLSHAFNNTRPQGIDFGANLAGTTLKIYERGLNKGSFGTLNVGDTVRVAVEGGAVKYYINSNLVYISATAPTYPLMMDAIMSTMSGSVYNAYIGGANLVPNVVPTPTVP